MRKPFISGGSGFLGRERQIFLFLPPTFRPEAWFREIHRFGLGWSYFEIQKSTKKKIITINIPPSRIITTHIVLFGSSVS